MYLKGIKNALMKDISSHCVGHITIRSMAQLRYIFHACMAINRGGRTTLLNFVDGDYNVILLQATG